MELLPTFWTDEELALGAGTSLRPAMEAKMNSLYREYEELQQLTSAVPWCKDTWWDEVDGVMSFDDWKQVDAMYRSRALELPSIGDCMVPYIDFANHASGSNTIALYEADDEGNCLLRLRSDKSLQPGEELTITYGDEKGACEMIFSYGFLEDSMMEARTLFLGLAIPDDDPLKLAKQSFADCAPGVRLNVSDRRVTWDSDFVWLLVANEEDGLEFLVAETVDGDRELQAKWLDSHLSSVSQIQQRLQSHALWPIYQLRVAVILEDRVEQQLQSLMQQGNQGQESHDDVTCIRAGPRRLAERLRSLETDLLQCCRSFFERERLRLSESSVVQQYLEAQQGQQEDDFS